MDCDMRKVLRPTLSDGFFCRMVMKVGMAGVDGF